MNQAQGVGASASAWLASLSSNDGPGVARAAPQGDTVVALAEVAAEAMRRGRSLLVITVDDGMLADMSNAVPLDLRPLCLALPAADYAIRIILRATLSLLKSRLARIGDDSSAPAWAAQRRRLADAAGLWQQCLAWAERGGDTEPWPSALPSLFPLRVLSLPLARRLAATADWVIVVDAAHQPDDARAAWPGALRTLLLGVATGTTAWPTPTDAASRLRIELEVLTQELAELELELATAQAEIAGFTRRYHTLIGTRMATLDALRAELAVRRAAADPDDLDAIRVANAARAQAERSHRESERFFAADGDSARAFAASDDLRKLYRKLAQRIHPDRAADDDDRAWRTQLMSEANRAYRAGDETALREILALWQEGGSQARATDDDALATQVERLQRRVAEIAGELNRLFGSKLYELFTATGIARRAGRDLLQEMADRLDADIGSLRAALGTAN